MTGPIEALGGVRRSGAPDEVAGGVAVEDVGELDDAVLHPAGQGRDLSHRTAPAAIQVEVDDQVDGAGDGGDHEVAGDVLPCLVLLYTVLVTAVKTVLIYARVSHTDGKSATSVTSQLKELRAWAEREGWIVIREFAEQGSASAFAKAERSVWNEVLAAVRARHADALLTWESSRATRDLSGYVELREACGAAGMAWGYMGTLHDLSDRAARFRTGLDALLAEDEVARTHERVLRGVRDLAERGLPHGRHLYGYQRIYDGEGTERHVVSVVEDPVRAPIVREIAERVLAGEALYSISHDLNKRRVTAAATDLDDERRLADGKEPLQWSGAKLRGLLRRPGYAGLRTYRKEIIGDATWPPILDRDTWDRLQALLDDPSRLNGSGEWRAQHLLTGIARCRECGEPLVCRVNHSRRRFAPDGTELPRRRNVVYQCNAGAKRRGAGFHVTMKEDFLDSLVVEALLARLHQPDVLEILNHSDGTHAEERAALRAEIDADKAYLRDVAEQAAANRNLALRLEQEALVRPRIEANEKRLRTFTGTDPAVLKLVDAENIHTAWEALDLETRRRVIRAMMTPFLAKASRPGRRGVDPERVHIDWK